MASEIGGLDEQQESDLETAREQMAQWRNDWHQLLEQTKLVEPDAEAEVGDSFYTLRVAWEEVEASFTNLEQAQADSFAAARDRWQEDMQAFKLDFLAIVDELEDEEVPSGWLRRFADDRF